MLINLHVNVTNMSKLKNIQSQIEMVTYLKLKRLSMIQKKSLKELIKEAIIEFTKRHETPVKKDSIFRIVGDFETREGNWSQRRDWRD